MFVVAVGIKYWPNAVGWGTCLVCSWKVYLGGESCGRILRKLVTLSLLKEQRRTAAAWLWDSRLWDGLPEALAQALP